ncbi:MAG: polysaccharide deacetylase family protein, partial [bacterium]|nr:polysaccharide deacetylase family protein [bacterium]
HEWLMEQGVYPTTSIAVEKIGRPGYLTWEQVEKLHQLGFPFISHTWSHKSLTECTPKELFYELHESRLLLSEKLGEEVLSICFPRGLFSKNVINVAAESGYKIGLASIPGNATPLSAFGDELSIYPRNLVQFSPPSEFNGVLNGAMNFLQSYYAKRHFVKS